MQETKAILERWFIIMIGTVTTGLYSVNNQENQLEISVALP